MNWNNHSTALRFEFLEQRQLLAGDIDARAIGSVLYITGDNTDNGVVVHSTSEGVIEILGLSEGGAATTINGKESESFVRIKDVFITLDDGNDTLILTDLTLSGSATIRTGDGNDFIGLGEFDDDDDLIEDLLEDLAGDVLGALTVKGAVNIDAADGNDTLLARNTTLNLSTIIFGKGNDTLTFDRNGEPADSDYVPGVTTTGPLTITLGDGQNAATFEGLTAQNLTVSAGNEQDTLIIEDSTVSKATNISVGDGTNTVSVEDFQGKSLGIALGVGNDTVTLEDITTTGRTVVGDGFGNDTLTITNLTAKSLGASMGIGNDTLTVTNATIAKSLDLAGDDGDDTVTLVGIIGKSLDVWLDAGNDNLSLQNVAITKKLSLSGGLGNDSIEVDGASASTLSVVLGTGDDDLELGHVIIAKATTLDGGAGANTYTDNGANSLAKLKTKNFPTVV